MTKQQQAALEAINKAATMTAADAAASLRATAAKHHKWAAEETDAEMIEMYTDDASGFEIIADWMDEGLTTLARQYAGGLETAAREEIDMATYAFMGGELLHDPRN